MTGYVHSVETFGAVDGPGIRYVVFFQGCSMRCKYCHNPDTWTINMGERKTVDELLEAYLHNSAYYRNGGITATGGEPLLQLDFLTELFEKAKEYEIHTCLDTSGVIFDRSNLKLMERIQRLLVSTDLVLLDIKHIDDKKHQELTGHSNQHALEFEKYLNKRAIPVWIRHVVIPGITDQEEDLFRLGYYLGQFSNIKELEVFPYHSMGKVKYDALGMDYALKDTPDLSKEDAKKAKTLIMDGMKNYRREHI